MKKSDIKSSADMFLYKAIIDFNSAKYLLQAFNDDKIEIDMEKIYFDLQQCAEKLLKSLLTKNKIKIERTHDIEKLIDICKINNISLVDEIEELITLTDYAIEGRYDIICDDLNDSDKYIDILEKLIEFTKKQIKEK